MVDQAENEGGLDEHESELIRNAIEFNDLEVSEILTPGWISWRRRRTAPWRRWAPSLRRAVTPACPSITDSIDNIVGVIHEKDFYAARYRGRP